MRVTIKRAWDEKPISGLVSSKSGHCFLMFPEKSTKVTDMVAFHQKDIVEIDEAARKFLEI